jgi:outer membrane scaffolding protein for murein synthesis (MipA/OmpV family)
MRRFWKFTAALTICAPVFALAGTASAADLGGGYKDGGGAPVDEWAMGGLTVGGILVVKPKYEGSSDYELVGFPYILPDFGGAGAGFFDKIDVRDFDDVRFELIQRDGFIAGPVVGYSFGRDEDDGDLLEGLGDIDGGVVAGAFIGYRWGNFQVDSAFRHFFDDSEGFLIDIDAKVERPISERMTLTGSIGATYADDNYMDTYFGAPGFEAESGFKDVHVEVGLKADLDAHWSTLASVRYSRLLGDAADSPIVEDENQWQGLLGLSYKFGVDQPYK